MPLKKPAGEPGDKPLIKNGGEVVIQTFGIPTDDEGSQRFLQSQGHLIGNADGINYATGKPKQRIQHRPLDEITGGDEA